MKDFHKVSINWDLEIPRSLLIGNGRGTFSILNNIELVMAYNQENVDNFHEKGKLVQVKQGEIKDIFETEYRLWAPVLVNKDFYLVTSGVIHGETSDNGILFKIDSINALNWQYQLDGESNSLPVIWQDSIFITDFIRSDRYGYLYRFTKQGDLVLKKSIPSYNNFEPWILKNKEQIILSFNKPQILMILDFKGNIKQEKSVSQLGTILFSQNTNGNLFGAFNNSIVALNDNLDILWEYKPEKGFAHIAPVSDLDGNLYSLLSGYRLVSLDSKGKERWITKVFGHGYQPIILNNGNILMVTMDNSGKKCMDEQYVTQIEIFSNDGGKTLIYELPGFVFHAAIVNNDTLFVVTNSRHVNEEEETEIRSIKVFSLKLQ